MMISRAFFYHLLHVVPARSALFEKWNALFSPKTSKTTCRLRGCSVLNALNLEKWGLKIHNCALLLDFLALFWLLLLFSRISPDWIFSIFFVFTVVFLLELETRLYYLPITITTDISPAQMGCSRTRKWILWYMTTYELWNSITFLIFKMSLAITPNPRASLWRIAYENQHVTNPQLELRDHFRMPNNWLIDLIKFPRE